MAIIFPSSQKRKKILLRAVLSILAIVLSLIPIIIFSNWPKNKTEDSVIKQDYENDIKIDFSIIDLDIVKNLNQSHGIKREFSYSIQDKNGKQLIVKILADDKNGAENSLINSGVSFDNLKEVGVGKKNPFLPYY